VPQPTETSGQLFVIVIDETYGGDEATYEEDSEQYRQNLIHEFGKDFEEVNVGPGADIPAFLTDLANTSIPLWSAVLGAFFLGKPIKDNLDAWLQMRDALRRFFSRPVVLARHGAAVLAINAIVDEIGDMPRLVRLLSYRVGHISEGDGWKQIDAEKVIQENPPTLNLGYLIHVFEIEADDSLFRIAVDGKKAEVVRIDF
jgi:hypothetical protein